MFYSQRVSYNNSGSKTVEFWCFANKQDRDHLLASNPLFFAVRKSDIPTKTDVKIFKYFKESFSGKFLIPVN